MNRMWINILMSSPINNKWKGSKHENAVAGGFRIKIKSTANKIYSVIMNGNCAYNNDKWQCNGWEGYLSF